MAADDALVLSVVARCFTPVPDELWEQTVAGSSWDEFLSAARDALQGERLLGQPIAPARRIGRRPSFSEFLSEREVEALYYPPDAEARRRFFARHFTGGLPASALPVESLYVPWSDTGMFAGESGLYNSDVARYLRDLAASMQVEIPAEFVSAPDHLAVELELLVLFVEAGLFSEARQFAVERLAWLETYRPKLMALGDEALFWLALVDLLIGIRACQESLGKASAPAADSAGAHMQEDQRGTRFSGR